VGFFDNFRRQNKNNHKEYLKAKEENEKKKDAEPEPVEEEEETTDEEMLQHPAHAKVNDEAENQDSGSSDSGRDAEATSETIQQEPENVSRETKVQNVDEFVETPIRTYDQKKPVKHTVGQTKVLAILNQKGGVGKSTTAINLGAALGARGKQVLLIDLDPQGNTTSGLGVEKGKLDHCIYDVLLHDTPLTDIIIPDVCEELDLAPATINLAGAEVELVSVMARENRLKEALGPIRGKYDYIFIDCPPSLGLLTINALVASDKLFIPIQCEFYALEGVTKLLDTMQRVQNYLNPSLDIYGVLLTMYDGRTTLSKQVAREVRNYFGKLVFKTKIPRSVKVSEAPSYGIPITEYDPTGRGAEAYNALAEEVIERG
jgi:chromosome partitioning protein